ncbi:MAG: hypothetical protein R2795_24830 [Saprospiraceae bacterium]
MSAFRNDSAIHYFSQAYELLLEAGEEDTPLGWQVQQYWTEALEKDDRDEEAIKQLIELLEKAKRKEMWHVVVNAELSLARLYEKLGMGVACRQYLTSAEKILTSYQLDSLGARLSIRQASYHRIFASLDTARYYTQQAIDQASRYRQDDFLANGYLLMGLLMDSTEWERSIDYFQKAGQIWDTLGNHSAVSFMSLNIARRNHRNGRWQAALRYSDASLESVRKAAAKGYDDKSVFWIELCTQSGNLQ